MTTAAKIVALDPAAFQARRPVIGKAAVIGSGLMGGGIAAQFANAGIPVVLLDIPAREGDDPRAIAKAGIANQLKAGGFMHPDAAALVTPGTTEHDLHLLADADWIVEAVTERLDIKQDLFRKIEAVRKDGSIVSSNTSTLARELMLGGLPERLARDFIITHFFNPPRHMRLVEFVSGPEVSAETLKRAHDACDLILGKTVVPCRDTPGFIANRIGCYWMALAAVEAIEAGLDVEVADALISATMAIPRTGVFGLFDLIGIDLVPHAWASLHDNLPASDPLNAYDLRRSDVFNDMLENRRYGRKTRAGFYRQTDGVREAWDYQAKAYRPQRALEPDLQAALKDTKALFARADAIGRFLRRTVGQTVSYAAYVAPEIASEVRSIDTAMALGYAWGIGPFALGDRVGAASVVQWLEAEKLDTPPLLRAGADKGFYGDGGKTWLATDGGQAPAGLEGPPLTPSAMTQGAPVFETSASVMFDIGDGVAALELRTKMNVWTPQAFADLERAIETLPGRFKAMVLIGGGVRAFSAGADLSNILAQAQAGDFEAVDAFVATGQHAFTALRQSKIPVVAAGFGLALGGGCEALLHAQAVVAHAELNAGLVETKVGLVPGWGGCTRLYARALEAGLSPAQAADEVFDAVFAGRTSASALDAASFRVLRAGDVIVMNRDNLLVEAKVKALSLAGSHKPVTGGVLQVEGEAGRARLLQRLAERPQVTAYDQVIGEVLAGLLSCGGPSGEVPESAMMQLERDGLVGLSRRPETQARISHMLATGKPLRN